MTTDPHAHPADHPDREIEEDVLAVPFIAWLGIVGAILTVASVLALTGMYYQTLHGLERRLYAEAEASVTPAEAKVAADRLALLGYYRGVPSPDGVVESAAGADARQFVSIPVAEGKKKVLEQYGQ
jgi:hypothetical protein